MKLQMPRGRLPTARQTRLLFIICWAAYVTAYLGRLNYGACLVEVSRVQGWDKGEAGLVATTLFAAYGAGQVFNGFFGDHVAPRYMVACGLGCSGLVNLLFPQISLPTVAAVLWGINGFSQSMIWPSLIRLLSERLPAEKRLGACANMNGTVPVGTFLVYGLSSALVYIGRWKWVFYISSVLQFAAALVFFRVVGHLDHQALQDEARQETNAQTAPKAPPFLQLALASALPLSFLGVLMQGMLKDGVTTWIPVYLEEQFHIPAFGAILSTMVVPLINLSGVFLASWLNRRLFHSEALGAFFLFIAGLANFVLLSQFMDRSAPVSLLLLAAATTLMMGINTLVAGMMPSYFVRYGTCSAVAGVLNSGVYLGSALSSFLNGIVVKSCGWNVITQVWCFYAVVGIFACALSARRWKQFRGPMG